MIQARPTTYRGIAMRSRLEARFAADLDRYEVRWVYEPRAFANEIGQYLPDFQIIGFSGEPDRSADRPMFVEVRPTIEGAYRAMSQMSIILDSHPDAYLVVMSAESRLFWSSHPCNRTWRLISYVGKH